MKRNRYSISYGPPLTVKDQPHRALDTARGTYDSAEGDTDNNNEVIVIGEPEVVDAVEIFEPEIEEVEVAMG